MALDIKNRISGKIRHLMADKLERGHHNAITVAVASSKGGVGKTTTAVNLGAALANAGMKVLLLDLDPQAHVAAALRSDIPVSGPSVSQVLLGQHRDICETAYASTTANLDLAGSDKTLAETEMILSAKIGKEFLLDGALEITRTRYDIILLDCPPNLGTITLNALCAADQLLIPCDMSVLALEGVGDILDAVDTLRSRLGQKLEILGVVATRVDRRATRMNDDITQSVTDLFGDRILRARIPQNSALNRAHLAGKHIFDFARTSPGAQAYAALAEEITAHLRRQPTQLRANI